METIGYIATGITLFMAIVWFTALVGSYFQKSPPPRLAGTEMAELGAGIDLSRRYNIAYSGDHGSTFVERVADVRIVGYVGQEDDEALGKMYMRSRWLVVEFRDGRKAYLMPRAILALEETAEADVSPG